MRAISTYAWNPIHVVFPVIVAKFFSCLYVSAGMDVDTFSIGDGFAVGFTGMVDVPGDIVTSAAIDGPLGVWNFEEIEASLSVSLFLSEKRSKVFDDK